MLIINCLSSCMLHFTVMSCSTLAGFSEALLGVKMLPATLPRFEQGEQKTILARLESKGNCLLHVDLPPQQQVNAAVSICQQLVATAFPLKLAVEVQLVRQVNVHHLCYVLSSVFVGE